GAGGRPRHAAPGARDPVVAPTRSRNEPGTPVRYNGGVMSSVAHSVRRIVSRGRTAPAVAASVSESPQERAPAASPVPVDIAPNDPIIPFFQSAAGAVDIDALELDSPALEAMRAAGVKLVVPLVTQGELIGLLNLGPRLSDQEYSGDDRRLLESLAAQAAPAVRVGQLVREQEAEVRSRERLDQ